MVENKARNMHNNKSWKIGRGCYLANSHPKTPSQKEKMRKLKQFVIQEVVHKLNITKNTHKKIVKV